jgi:hypothetical protein
MNKPELRPELRPYGYAPGTYMGTCYVGSHVAENVAKRATCCLACAEQLYRVNTMSTENPIITPGLRETAPGLEDPGEPVPMNALVKQSLAQYVPGKLTAMQDTSIALVVEGVNEDSDEVRTMRFVGTDIRRETYPVAVLIGAGDELVFTDGVFVRAQ